MQQLPSSCLQLVAPRPSACVLKHLPLFNFIYTYIYFIIALWVLSTPSSAQYLWTNMFYNICSVLLTMSAMSGRGLCNYFLFFIFYFTSSVTLTKSAMSGPGLCNTRPDA
jgi:hypothetical protein